MYRTDFMLSVTTDPRRQSHFPHSPSPKYLFLPSSLPSLRYFLQRHNLNPLYIHGFKLPVTTTFNQ